MVKLLLAMQTVAFLADAGCYDDAFQLLGVLDQIAMGLELYSNEYYRVAREALLVYINRAVNTPGDWHSNEW